MQHDREVPHQVRFASLKSLRTMSKGGQFADHAKTELARRKVEGGFASTKAKHLDKKARMARAIKRDAAAEKTRARFRRGPASNAGEWS
jgi:hypothetical protein